MLNPNGQSTVYVLDALGNFHRMTTTIQPLGPRSDIMMAAAAEEGHVIPNFARIGELPVHLYAARQPALAVRLPFLRMRTYFRAHGVGENMCLIPWFVPDNSVDLTCEWVPPYNCDLFFVYSAGDCYLVAGYTAPDGRRTLRRMPLPNVHNDARVCMGTWRPNANDTRLDQLNSALTSFTTSEWNADLLEDKRSMLADFMRFSVDERKQLPPRTHPWYDYSVNVAGVSYNWVVNLMQGVGIEPPKPAPPPVPPLETEPETTGLREMVENVAGFAGVTPP